MDALPPEPIHCEIQAEQMRVEISGSIDEASLAAFLHDVRSKGERWEIVSDKTVETERRVIFRASLCNPESYPLQAVSLNAQLRGWEIRVLEASR